MQNHNMNKGLTDIVSLGIIAVVLLSGVLINQLGNEEEQNFGAPSTLLTYEATLLPLADSLYDIGTSTQAWRQGHFDELCLTADSCQTAWSAGGGEANTASSLGTGLNLFDSKSGVDLRFNTIAAGTNVTFSTTTNDNTIEISSTGGSGTFAWTTSTTYGELTSATTTPLWLQDTLYASSTSFFGGNVTITGFTTEGFVVNDTNGLLTSSSTIGSNFIPDLYVLNSGDTMTGGLTFSGVATDITTVGAEDLTLVPAGAGTLSLSAGSGGVSIATNSGNSDITLNPHGTGDIVFTDLTNAVLSVDASGNVTASTTISEVYIDALIARDSELHDAVTLAGQDYLTLSTQQITAGEINSDDLSATDFGDFTCDGNTAGCTLDTGVVADNEIDYSAITIDVANAITAPNFIQDTTATSTFAGHIDSAGNVEASAFQAVTSTSTLAGLILSNLDCSGFTNSGKLTVDVGGNVSCGDDTSSAGGGTFAWTPATTYNENTSATTTPLWLQDTLYASSTSFFTGDVTMASASTTVLTVTGSELYIAQDLTHEGDEDTFIRFTDNAINFTNGASTVYTSDTSGVNFNPVGDNNWDFTIEAGGVTDAFYMWNSQSFIPQKGNIGIGTTTPYSTLTVDGTFAVGTNGTEFTVDANGNATTSSLYITNSGTAGTECLQIDINGLVSPTGSGCGGGSGDPFAWTPSTTYNENTSATTTPLWLQDSLYASSTSFFTGLATFENATTTHLTVNTNLYAPSGFGGTGLTVSGNTLNIDDNYVLNTGDSITVADTGNLRALTIAQNDTTNNPEGVRITTTAAENGLVIDCNADCGNSTSAGGALLIDNTGNIGAGQVIYSDADGTADGRLLVLRADNAAFNQQVLFIQNDGLNGAFFSDCNNANMTNNCGSIDSEATTTTAFGVTSPVLSQGVTKFTHEYTSGDDSNASTLSLLADGTGTAAQGIFFDSTVWTTGKILNLRQAGTEIFVLDANANLTMASSTGSLTIASLTDGVYYGNGSGVVSATTSPLFYERTFTNWASSTPNISSSIYASGATSTISMYLPRAVDFTGIGGNVFVGTSLTCQIGNGSSSSTAAILTTTAAETSITTTLSGQVFVACGSGVSNPDDASFTIFGEYAT